MRVRPGNLASDRGSVVRGARFGPYEVLGPLGSGGMGEVYRARDDRLARDVALKILRTDSTADPDRLRRFELEAKAAGALNHPNLLAVFDTGHHQNAPYVVFELLEGETLRERLESGRLPTRTAVDYAVQIALGLAAAHEAGIVHRDLKPENLFVTKDGRVKILDFGLAKLRPELEREGTESEITRPGALVGTPSYMSPEQVRGAPTDHRSDIFSFGSVLYEMLTGQKAFRRDSKIESMRAILKEDPAELAKTNRDVPSTLERLLRRCLEKRPEERFQSARDVAFALEALSASSGSGSRAGLPAPGRLRRPLVLALAATALISGAALAGFLLGEKAGHRPPPQFQQLTFRRGSTWGARFAPDGQTIFYGAAWDGQPIRIFTTRTDGPESRPLDLPDADILAVSSLGELAISLHRNHLTSPDRSVGTLARVSLAGGAPHEIAEDVSAADWSPDGKEMAITRDVGGKRQLEFPIGHVVYEKGYILSPRISPRGDLVAFADDEGISVVDRAGTKRTLAAKAKWVGGTLAWSPRGDEVWYPARDSPAGTHLSLYAVSLGGRRRLLARYPGWVKVHDVSREGRILTALGEVHNGIVGVPPGQTRERDLSWLDFGWAADLSDDGRTLLFTEQGEGAGSSPTVYLRKTDGSSPPVRLGEGFAAGLSRDLKWALCGRGAGFTELALLPTGPGEPKSLKDDGILRTTGGFFPDGKQVWFNGQEPGHRPRCYAQDIAGGRARPLTPEGVRGEKILPDGRSVLAKDAEQRLVLYPVEGGDPQRLPGPPEPGSVHAWTPDGRALYASERHGLTVKVFRRELASGRREPWMEITPADPTGISTLYPLFAADGKSYVYTYVRFLSNLYLIEGLE